MSETKQERWEETLGIVERAITAKSFSADLEYLREQYGDHPGVVAAARVGMIAEFFVEMIGLDTLLLPREETAAALAETRQRLIELDFESPRADLDEDELPYYEAFADFAAPIFGKMSRAMEAMLTLYVAGDYDPADNPNDLVAEALEMADEDLEAARYQISQAGATALHGQPFWWRWEDEAYGPAAPWLRVTATLVEDYTMGGKDPMGSPEQAKEDLEAIIERIENEEPTEEETEETEPVAAPIDDLINELIERGEAPITEEQIALCQEHREEAIPALIHLASDEDLQLEGAPGDGYAPIRAVELLRELKAAEAVPTLIDLVADGDTFEIIYNVASVTLEKLGPIARDDVLTFLRYSHDVETKTALAGMLDTIAQADDEAAYRLLLQVWEDSAWEYGKCMLAYPMLHFGEEEAIEMIRQALAEEDLTPVDHNELVFALEDAGMDAPPTKDTKGISPTDQTIRALGDPEDFLDFAESLPDLRDQPEELAEKYVDTARSALMRTVSVVLMILTADELRDRVVELVDLIEDITFNDPPPGYPDYALASYAHVVEFAEAEVCSFGIGLLLPFQVYLDQEYDAGQSPNDLIEAARQALPDTQQARTYFAEAGALVLAGKPIWDLWPLETPDPLGSWMFGFFTGRDMLEGMGQIPFEPVDDPQDRSQAWQTVEDELPSEVEEILDFLFERSTDWIPPAERPDFERHRSDLIPKLVRIIRNPTYAYDNAPGGGWAPILATRILGELEARQAADTLVWAMVLSRPNTYIHDAAIFSLTALGTGALPAVKRYYRYGQDVAKKATLAEVLGLVGEDDRAVFPLLKEVWEAADWAQNRRAVALAFGDLGDLRAEPLLQEAVRDPRADRLDRDYVWLALMELGVNAPNPPQTLSQRLRTPAPTSPRVTHDELGRPQRLIYTAWGEAICPDCGDLMVENKRGRFVHLGIRGPRKHDRHR